MINNNINIIDIEAMIALSDETRIQILDILKNGEMNVNEIANNCKVTRPTISHHLQIMKRAGILNSEKEGKEVFYSINKSRFTSIAQSILSYVKW
jgi:DNA-binding transcriptional ArsR family regulator